MKVKSESEVTQSCLTLSDPMDCSLPGSSISAKISVKISQKRTKLDLVKRSSIHLEDITVLIICAPNMHTHKRGLICEVMNV